MRTRAMFLLRRRLSDPFTHLADLLRIRSYVSDLVIAPTPPHHHLAPPCTALSRAPRAAHARVAILLPVLYASLTHCVLSACKALCNTIFVLDCT